MLRVCDWPAANFVTAEIVWLDITDSMLDWLENTVGGRYRFEFMDGSNRGAICFESDKDSTMFKLTWL